MLDKLVTLLLGICLSTLSATAQTLHPYLPIQVPTRDGKVLSADLYTTDTTLPRPVILIQTPYNKNFYRLSVNIPPEAGGSPFPFDSNYNYVTLDWRGFYGSKDAAVSGYDRGLDGYDAVEWIASQTWCDGKVGTWGPSALGTIQFQTAEHHPPHLVCSVPLVKDFKGKYTDYYYGGVYRKEHTESLQTLGFVSTALILAHPTNDIYFRLFEASTDAADSIAVPMLLISGWFDHYPDDVIRAYGDLRAKSDPAVRGQHRLMMGPWLHSGVDKSQQGALEYPDVEGAASAAALQFFDYYLRGIANGYDSEPNVRYYQMGSNVWRSADGWETIPTTQVQLSLAADGTLTEGFPSGGGIDQFQSDPRNPVPAIGGSRFVIPIIGGDVPVGPQDQRQEVESRSDVLLYTTDELTEDLAIDGPVTVDLYVSSDRTDTDIDVRLCDVYPDGRSMLITHGIRRLRFRDGYTPQDTMIGTPGQIYPLRVELQNLAMTWVKGHRLRIIVSSSAYPHFDLNLNNGGEMYVAGDTLVATNTIYHSAQFPSAINLPVVAGTSGFARDAAMSFHTVAPNPFDRSTSFRFRLDGRERVTLAIFDLLGKEVARPFDGELDPGDHSIPFSADGLSDGTYLYRLTVSGHAEGGTLHLLR